ncbi:hypothetical protein SAMN05720470_101412 [Fibrobacter sp. UWOV1]|uniref:hypothetical protein n=1 Tax=Fibrobacter sp. UWOV1 TaxID=1896215 RepID=UPI000915D98B|nr:hypothetical protein [Fibrobacter sp. UWOV1]SHK44755.1 hypothetical protein SAMN05720470_101412 [Fibrobacter sp. UWOV1]
MKISHFIIFVLIGLCIQNAFALDRIWNMRYTLGPDARPSPKFAAGLGLRSDFGSNVLFPVNILGALNKEWELGAKVDMYTYNQMDNMEASIDIGGRYRMGAGRFVELDGYFGLNRNNGSAMVLTYGKEVYIASSFSNTYEARAGFFDGVTGDDGYVKFAFGTIPTLHFGRSFLCMIEITSSGSVGHFRDDFMVDIIPKMELAFGSTRVRLEFDIGILQDDNNDQKSIGLYVQTAL